MPCLRVSKCPKDVAHDKGGYFRTSEGVKRGIDMKSEARASMKVDKEGDPNARCQYATNRAQGSSCRVKRLDGAWWGVGGVGTWRNHRSESGVFEP